ncbi:carbamoyltransferase C-terminal domain-containing protein [Actinokineospora auranticolor]|uniref:Hydroxymethyl cephem carbamoyltransferase n=1 Tax=Actinokineospora auranticolor TaxID=155976 RepID=A0A2S6GJ91_9PSEU|nr:carbamoyltransferase C-terminal domain-containing protein [Actinokineospora auranticolor]PPK65221.1 hydroxymethyl cephem carbamoyltransferase [Actinokineospora auranticolor]
MLILSFKEGHDGAVVAVEDGTLLFSLEAEKDNYPRYDRLTADLLLRAADRLDRQPDAVAVGGWVKGWHSVEPPAHTGYFGVGPGSVTDRPGRFLGKPTRVFSSTHERSHIMTAYGLGPVAAGQPCYCLVWEGNIGSFYRVDETGAVTHLEHVLTDPGNKYAYLFALADPRFPDLPGHFRFQDAGKQMALTGFAERGPVLPEEKELIEYLLDQDGILLALPKSELSWSPFHNVGVLSQEYKNLAAKFSDAIFGRFHDYAARHLTEGLPLLLSGGCGLNCEWNRRWADCGLFAEVFVPPCPNDSGSALGTAIDAQLHYTGSARVAWDAYAGEEFVEDAAFDPVRYDVRPLDHAEVARFLEGGNVIGWARGRYEMGPRALGARSILAAPFTRETHARLNTIKQREPYRPIAPICLAGDADRWFAGGLPDPFMLYFTDVRTDALKAVTHVDGTARVQTVTPEQNPGIARLLTEFRALTGYSVLCNTSLNFSGRGFINRTSDLITYGEQHGLDGYVVNDLFATRKSS